MNTDIHASAEAWSRHLQDSAWETYQGNVPAAEPKCGGRTWSFEDRFPLLSFLLAPIFLTACEYIVYIVGHGIFS